MNLKKHNWKNFTEQHLYDWHGIWTTYTSTGDVQDSFKSLRSFRSNPEKTEVFHTNRYFYTDGKVEEKKWHLKKQEFSQENGSISFFFEQGAFGWLGKQLQSNSMLPMELLFKYEHLRHSVIIVYDQKGNLSKIINIREDSQGFPSSHWSRDLEQLSQRDLQGNWEGTAINFIAPDLQVSEPIKTQFSWVWESHKAFFLPDGVSISCPTQVSVGTPFTCVANWLINKTQMQQLIANYDPEGTFQSLTLESYELKL